MTDLKITRVIIVDDDPDDAYIAAQLLRSSPPPHQYEVHTHLDINNIADINFEAYDVCLLDYDLGMITGIEFLEMSARSSIPFIVLSGAQDITGFEKQFDNAQIMHFVSKHELTQAGLSRTIQYSIKQFEQLKALAALAVADADTGLASQVVFNKQLEQLIDSTTDETISVLGIDVRDHSNIERRFGSEFYATIMKSISDLLLLALRERELISRTSSSRILVTTVSSSPKAANERVTSLQQKLVQHVSQAFPEVDDLELKMASISENLATNASELLAALEFALSESHHSGGSLRH